VPVIDYEIGHINISIPGLVTKNSEGVVIAEDDGKAVVDWHRDSYPFVCVLMMSDTTGMVGGETALKAGNGGIMKVRGPTKVRKDPLEDFLGLTITRAVPSFFKVGTSNTKPCGLSALGNELPWLPLFVLAHQ
jgi:hypothetical protein